MAFDPGPGWRRSNVSDWPFLKGKFIVMWDNEEPQEVWHYVVPVPLPTEPWTVVRVEWEHGDEHHCYVLGPDGWWQSTAHNRPPIRSTDLAHRITGFEVLAEPHLKFNPDEIRDIKARTAQAIFDAFEEAHWDTSSITVERIFREFGATP